jgi:hypothetical protein
MPSMPTTDGGGVRMIMVLSLVINGAVFGLIVAMVLKEEFPGWGIAIGCALGVAVGSGLLGAVLPDGFQWLSALGGGAAGVVLVRWLTTATLRQACWIVGSYLAFGLLVGLLLG